MSSLAAFRPNARDDLTKLAERHLEHDLQPEDRNRLQKAASKLSTHAMIGSIIGIGAGVFLAMRLRNTQKAVFQAFRAREKPVRVQFSDGRTEPIPDVEPLMKPTRLGDIATYTLFPLGGLFLGGEMGLLTGTASARRTIVKDPESTKRIENAFRKFRADVLRKEANALDGGESVLDKLF